MTDKKIDAAETIPAKRGRSKVSTDPNAPKRRRRKNYKNDGREKIFHANNYLGDLRHVVNLSVKHGAAGMFETIRGDNVHLPVVVLFGDNADN